MLIFFLTFAHNINMHCGYSLETPRRGGSNENPQSMLWSKYKNNRSTPVSGVYMYGGIHCTDTFFFFLGGGGGGLWLIFRSDGTVLKKHRSVAKHTRTIMPWLFCG